MNQRNSQIKINCNDDFIHELQNMAADGTGVPREFLKDQDGCNFAIFVAALFNGMLKRAIRMEELIARGLINPIIFESVEKEEVKRLIEFPCPENGNIVKLSICFDCHKSKQCDIYATMLDEDYD